jgi:hypothetical protein
MQINLDDILKIAAAIAQLEQVIVSQYQKYQAEKGLNDAEMKQHLKDMNLEDADGFDKIIQLAGGNV